MKPAKPAAPAKTSVKGVTLSPDTGMAPGPFSITPVSCGKYTPAQQNQFSTNATGGLVFKYTNESQDLTGSPNLEVNFTNGSEVAGNNVSGGTTDIGPGQSAEASVDAVGGSSSLKFTGCELMTYGVDASNGGAQPGNFAPRP